MSKTKKSARRERWSQVEIAEVIYFGCEDGSEIQMDQIELASLSAMSRFEARKHAVVVGVYLK